MDRTAIILAICCLMCGCSSQPDISFKDHVVAHFADSGFPLREVASDSNYMEYCFRVGPAYEYAIAVNLLDTPEERAHFNPQEFPIPSYSKHDIILWQWNLGDSNATAEYEALYNRLKKRLG